MSTNKNIRVEYDLNYSGGEFDKVGSFALIPIVLVDAFRGDVEKAFENRTGISPIHIIHYSVDEIYDNDGNRIDS